MSIASVLVIYFTTGCVAGYLAGLFGIGGGIVIVPVLTIMFHEFGFPSQTTVQLSVGTSMAVVALTAIVSARVHHKNGNVDWARVKFLMPCVVIGVLIGALIGASVSRFVLLMSVITFEIAVAVQFLYQAFYTREDVPLKPEQRSLPAVPMLGYSSILGGDSRIVGIAGGSLFVPFLTYCGVGLRTSIGTAAALGVPAGLVATAVYLAVGLTAIQGLPAYSVGYVYMPAFAGCVVGSLLTTKYGAELGKKMSVRQLKIAFAIVLLLAATKMIAGLGQ